jgi:hypothetical protein
MDWKQFLIGLISSIAWPAVAMIFLVFFKNELSKIIRRIAHLKYKDLELDFEKVKQQAENLHLEDIREEPESESPVFSSLEDQIFDAVERAPSTAILLAWSGLETAIAAAVSRLGISPDSPSHRSPMHNIEILAKNKQLSKNHEKLLYEMRMLRNKVAHEPDSMLSISQNQAMDYATTAIDLIKYFKSYQRIV